LPDGSLARLVTRRTPFCHPQVPFIVSWAQKAGCTTVLKWFLYHAGLLDQALAYGRKPGSVNAIHKYETEVFKQAPGYTDQLLAKLDAGCPVIHFMRCPYERAFSSYLHIHNPWYAVYPNRRPQEQAARRGVLQSVYNDSSCIEYPISFADYLQWLQHQDMETIDPHHRPQCSALCDAVPMEYYRLADFDAVIVALEQRFGLGPAQAAMAQIADSGHHVTKHALQKEAVLAFLQRGMPLNPSDNFAAPQVNRAVLAGTAMGDIIERVYARDIALYDQLPARGDG
jgi:hypothetical protein